jgi:hypothetical protein
MISYLIINHHQSFFPMISRMIEKKVDDLRIIRFPQRSPSNGHGKKPRPWISFSSCEIKVCKPRSLGWFGTGHRYPYGPGYSWGLGILWISMDVWMYFEWLFSDLRLIKTGWFIKSQPHQAICATLKFVTVMGWVANFMSPMSPMKPI